MQRELEGRSGGHRLGAEWWAPKESCKQGRLACKAEGGGTGKAGVWRTTAGRAMPAQQHAPGHGLLGAVVGWYLPMLVVNGEKMKGGGVMLKVLMKRVAVGRTTGGVE